MQFQPFCREVCTGLFRVKILESFGVSCVEHLCMNLIPDAPRFFWSVCCTQCPAQFKLDAHPNASCFHSVRVPEQGISSDPQHSSCKNSSTVAEPRWRDWCVVWSWNDIDGLGQREGVDECRNCTRPLLA